MAFTMLKFFWLPITNRHSLFFRIRSWFQVNLCDFQGIFLHIFWILPYICYILKERERDKTLTKGVWSHHNPFFITFHVCGACTHTCLECFSSCWGQDSKQVVGHVGSSSLIATRQRGLPQGLFHSSYFINHKRWIRELQLYLFFSLDTLLKDLFYSNQF